MRILYLSYDGLTDPLGQSQILPYVLGLVKKGHSIDIIAFEKRDRQKSESSKLKTICSDSGIGYFPEKYTKWPPVISTLLDIRQMKKRAVELQKNNDYDLVHCRSYIPAIIGSWLQQKYGLKFIFDMRGFYADERVDGEIWSLKNPVYRLIYKYFKHKELRFLKKADHIISLTESARHEILKWNVASADRISIIPCCVDLTHFDKAQVDKSKVQQIKNNLEITNENLVVGYVGSTGTWYLLAEMLQYFQMLLIKYTTAVLLFVTMDEPEKIWAEIRKTEIPESAVRIIASSREELPMYLSLFNWSVFFIKPVFSKKASSPTKHGELMSMGIPVVCNAGIGDTSMIVKKSKGGICLNDLSIPELDRAVDSTDQLLHSDPKTIIAGAEEYFSLENGVNKIDLIYHKLGR